MTKGWSTQALGHTQFAIAVVVVDSCWLLLVVYVVIKKDKKLKQEKEVESRLRDHSPQNILKMFLVADYYMIADIF